MDSRSSVPDFFERQIKPGGPGRFIAIPPLAVAVVIILLGFVVYRSIEIALVGVGLVLAVVLSLFYLESREEQEFPKSPVILERGDWVAIVLGLPALAVLSFGFLVESGWVILLGFLLMLVFFLVMGLHDRGPVAQTDPVH